MARSSEARKARLSLRPKNKGGRPRKVSDPLRLQKDAIGHALLVLHENGRFPSKGKIAKLANLLTNPKTEAKLERQGQLLRPALIGPDNLTLEKLKNQSHYTAQVLNGTTGSTSGYSPEEADFVIESGKLILEIFVRPHMLAAKFLGTVLIEQLGWPQDTAMKICDLAIMSHADDPRYTSPKDGVVELRNLLDDLKKQVVVT